MMWCGLLGRCKNFRELFNMLDFSFDLESIDQMVAVKDLTEKYFFFEPDKINQR